MVVGEVVMMWGFNSNEREGGNCGEMEIVIMIEIVE